MKVTLACLLIGIFPLCTAKYNELDGSADDSGMPEIFEQIEDRAEKADRAFSRESNKILRKVQKDMKNHQKHFMIKPLQLSADDDI